MEFYGKSVKAKEEQLINQYKEELNLIILDEIAERKIETKKELMVESLDKKISQKDWVKEPIIKYNENYEPQSQYEGSMYLLVQSKDGYEFLIKVDNKNNFAEIVNAGKKTEKTYIVTYSPNEGKGEEEQVEVRQGFSISLKECNYHKDGYKFGGWCEDADGKGKRYSPNATYKPEKDITLYVIWEEDREVPEYWEMIDKTDSEWHNYGNAKIMEPKLTGKMSAIKYVGENQTGNKWANAITKDGSMWVWIPRYAYKITSGHHSNTAGTIEVAFLDTSNNFLNGETGELTTNPNETGAGITKWLVHPAFTSNATNGGGFGEIEGLWVRKV